MTFSSTTLASAPPPSKFSSSSSATSNLMMMSDPAHYEPLHQATSRKFEEATATTKPVPKTGEIPGEKAVTSCCQCRTFFSSVSLLSLLFLSGYFFRDYIQRFLVVVEDQNGAVVFLALVLLYFFVSLPFAWGYIIVNIATGYLYGFVVGLLVTVVTASIGVLLAHLITKRFLIKLIRRWFLFNSTTLGESLGLVLSNPRHSFRIVALSRLTPVPFGIQNAFFASATAASSSTSSSGTDAGGIPTSTYLQATCVGLLPCQIINVYLGSTFRSMEEALANSETAGFGLLVLGVQVCVAVAVTAIVVRQAHKELHKSIGNNNDNNNFKEMGGPDAMTPTDVIVDL